MLAKGSQSAFFQYLNLKYDVTRRLVLYVYALCLDMSSLPVYSFPLSSISCSFSVYPIHQSPLFPVVNCTLTIIANKAMSNIPMTAMPSNHTGAPTPASNHESSDVEALAVINVKPPLADSPRSIHGWRWGLAGK